MRRASRINTYGMRIASKWKGTKMPADGSEARHLFLRGRPSFIENTLPIFRIYENINTETKLDLYKIRI